MPARTRKPGPATAAFCRMTTQCTSWTRTALPMLATMACARVFTIRSSSAYQSGRIPGRLDAAGEGRDEGQDAGEPMPVSE